MLEADCWFVVKRLELHFTLNQYNFCQDKNNKKTY